MWILLVWGERERERQLGFVADFCPVCRKVRPFAIAEVRMAAHFWFIPTEWGRFLTHRQTCRDCRTVRPCHLGQFHKPVSILSGSIDGLVEKTFPAVREVYARRLALEETVASDPAKLDAEVRAKLIVEAFELAEPHFVGGYGHEGRRILALTLQPLWPSETEIRSCLQMFRQKRSQMGRQLRTGELMASLYPETKPASPGSFDY